MPVRPRACLTLSSIATVLCALVLVSAPLAAQPAWPTRPLTMIVPFPPGGQVDLAARPIAAALEKTFGRPVVVENKAGAGGALGAAAVAKADPDGHTLLMTLNALLIAPDADRLNGRVPAYEVEQFVPVARVLADPNVLAVKASAPWATLSDLVADARKRPGEISFSSSGNYGAAHVSIEVFAQAAGIKMLHVPYRGAGPAITGLLGDQVALTATAAGTLVSHLEAGTLRLLGTMSTARNPALPQVPTLREEGYPAEFVVWAGLFVARGTPAPVVERLRVAMREAVADPAVLAIFRKAGTDAAYLDAPDFARSIEAEKAVLGPVIKAIGKLE